MATSTPTSRIAASVRVILAMFRLYADIESGFGRAIIDLLKKQYPGAEIDVPAGTIGHKMMAIARREVQNNDSDAYDVLQKFLTYITTGSEFVSDPEGNRVRRTKAEPFDFTKESPTWQDALKNIYSNIRLRGIEVSKGKTNRGKKERSVDQAYGKRPEGGGDAEGGEGRMPTPDDTSLGKALDDKAAIREFMSVIDDHIDDMRGSMPLEQQILFDLIMKDEIGGFGSDIKDNMGQATAYKEKLESGSPEEKAIYDKNAKRWSGFVGDTRNKLLDSIWNYVDKHLTPEEYRIMKETFFADTSPQAVRKIEKDKAQGKVEYQRGIDLRKYRRLQEKGDSLSDGDKKTFENLSKKLEAELKKEGKTLEQAVKAQIAEEESESKKKPEKKAPKEISKESSARIARRLSAVRPWALN